MPSRESSRQAAWALKAQLDKDHAAFKTFQRVEIPAALREEAGAGGQIKGTKGAAEMETALLEEGLLAFPGLETSTDGYLYCAA